jgi:3-oxoacyl-[acyl-carrier protein] reductase
MIIVTGSSRGIGNVIANRLSKNGYDVIGISRGIPQNDVSFKTYQADVSQQNTLTPIFEDLKEKNITVQALINCAGILETPFVDWLTIEQSEMESIFSTNVIGTMNSCQVFLPLMDKKQHTPIINMASLSAHSVTDFAIYGASKHAVYGFTKSLAKKLQNTSIRPNCISPGPIKSTMTEGIPDMAFKLFAGSQIINRTVFTSDDICNVVELLLDPKSSSLTGQAFHIGGY